MALSKRQTRNYNKKFAWKNVDIVFWENGVKRLEKMQQFFLRRPVFHFHKTMPHRGILIAYCPIYSEGEAQLPKDFVALSCTETTWKIIKRVAKWGIRYERRNLRKLFKQNREDM